MQRQTSCLPSFGADSGECFADVVGDLFGGFLRADQLSNGAVTGVGGQDEHGAVGVGLATSLVDDPAFVKQVEERLPDVGVAFLGFVQQEDGIRVGQQVVDQSAAFFVADVAGGNADETGDAVRFREVAHRVNLQAA